MGWAGARWGRGTTRPYSRHHTPLLEGEWEGGGAGREECAGKRTANPTRGQPHKGTVCGAGSGRGVGRVLVQGEGVGSPRGTGPSPRARSPPPPSPFRPGSRRGPSIAFMPLFCGAPGVPGDRFRKGGGGANDPASSLWPEPPPLPWDTAPLAVGAAEACEVLETNELEGGAVGPLNRTPIHVFLCPILFLLHLCNFRLAAC